MTKMISHYSKDRDYLEFFFERVENYAEFGEGVTVFRSEKDNRIVGYAIDDAFEKLAQFEKIDLVDKLGLLIKMSRIRNDYTQEEVSKKLSISLRHYQRLEAGQDTTVSLLGQLVKIFPQTNFASILHPSEAA